MHTEGSTTAREPGVATGSGAGSYVLEWVNCGSPYCRKCTPGGQGAHGPYWYVYLWRDDRHLKRYVGKTVPPSVVSDGRTRVKRARPSAAEQGRPDPLRDQFERPTFSLLG